MFRTIQIIYERLHSQVSFANPMGGSVDVLSEQAVRFLEAKSQIDNNAIYAELIKSICALKTYRLPTNFIERFCLGKISDHLLNIYPLNIAEAYVLGYVMLNRITELPIIFLKLGTSGLIKIPTLINGSRVQDIEAIAQFIIKSLTDAKLLKVTDNGSVIPGKLLQTNF